VALFRKKYTPPPAPVGQPFPGPYSESSPAAGARSRSEDAANPAESQLGTGHGRRETSHAQYVNFERASSTPAEVVTLYYDSHRNLVARGVIREPVAVPLPRPFPGFVPDPGA
jgi:hypothetical protein